MPNFDDKFWKAAGRELKRPNLACLRIEADLYKILLLQLNAELTYDNRGLYYKSPELAAEKFESFFTLASDTLAELVITPEYSCPWSVIDKLIRKDRLPDEENLWVVGSQSISPQSLQQFITDHPQVIWIYEEDVLEKSLHARNKFFDPICIMLKTRDKKGLLQNVVVIQFKTNFFGGKGFEWERNNLARGKRFFVIENKSESSRLVAFICSDTLGKHMEIAKLRPFFNHPYLFLHVQLNQRPNQYSYKDYRNRIYGGSFMNKEVITLNWAIGIVLDGKPWNSYGGSAFYLKSPVLDLSDQRLNANHRKGLYYTHWAAKKAHIYMFNYDEHVFLVENTKPSQLSDDPTQQKRSGPQMLELYSWGLAGWKATSDADDGFADVCATLAPDYGEMGNTVANTLPFDMERLINLSAGRSAFTSDWTKPEQLRSVQIKDDEIVYRTNFSHDPDPVAAKDRKIAVARFLELKNLILSVAANLPQRFFGATLSYDYNSPEPLRYLLNLHHPDRRLKGTAIFLGARGKSEALEFISKMEKLFTESQQGKNLLVYYYFNTQFCRVPEFDEPPRIIDNPGKSGPAINGRRPL